MVQFFLKGVFNEIIKFNKILAEREKISQSQINFNEIWYSREGLETASRNQLF